MTTKERLLEAALREFADRGYHGATIQAIVYRAGANQAAVNYHFGNKAKLYETVMRRAMSRLMRLRDNPLADWLGAEDPLETLVRELLHENLLPDGERALLHRLLAWEQLATSGVPGVQPLVMMDEHFRAVATLMAREIGCRPEDPEALMNAVALIGECTAFGRHHPLRAHALKVSPQAESDFVERTVSWLLSRWRANLALARDLTPLAVSA